MNSPRRADGPPVRDGKPYSAIAHLAEDIMPYVAVAAGLRDRGLSAPTILHADLAHGLVIMEDLGDDPIVARRSAGADRASAMRPPSISWRRCTASRCRRCCTVAPDLDYRLPHYDMEAFLIEAELLLDWYLPHATKVTVTDRAREDFCGLWREALAPAIEAPPTWVLRDYHSPNLMWLPRARRQCAHRPP